MKFAADPESPKSRLDWRWLTESKPGGKSLLGKWAETTLNHKELGSLASATLKTDRIPDAEFAACLNGSSVRLELLPQDVKALVLAQLGSFAAAQSFFDSFTFLHSQPRLDDLEDQLWSRIASDTDQAGWALFQKQVQRWSTIRGQPAPDGRIKYIHLRQALSGERSKPIPQSFLIPPSYSVPDEGFDKAFLAEATESDGISVLWGPPGRGKSTYLSHCIARIKPNDAVCVRHHYFLSLDDRSEGRFNYHAIARSIQHQLRAAIPNLNEAQQSLGQLVEEAASSLRDDQRRLVVIIDGLDHVWRDHRDHEDMEALFNALLPLPDNVRLIVGTQKIANEHLPARLLNALPTERWTELPLMSEEAVFRWLCFQQNDGRLNLKESEFQDCSEQVSALAGAFHKISQGLPLHLIYSFEALARTGEVVTAEGIAALPSCPTGDISHYYRSIWARMRPNSQVILHVMAGLAFGPPPFAMNDCFGRESASIEALAEINHLLDYQEMEVRPFHGSLFAFVRNLPDHQTTFQAHAVNVRVWLEQIAPEYWRWAWLWITKSQLGEESDLLNCPNRVWAVSALASGYPIEQVINILNRAEKIAFSDLDLPRFLVIRSLKNRVTDGPEYQVEDWALFLEMAATLSADQHAKAILQTGLHRAPARVMPYMVRTEHESVRSDLARRALFELQRRASARSPSDRDILDRQSGWNHASLGIVASTQSGDLNGVLEYLGQFEEPHGLVNTYVQASIVAGHFGHVLEVGAHYSWPQLDRDVFAALCLEGLAPSAKPHLKAMKQPAMLCLEILKGGTVEDELDSKRDLSLLFARRESGELKYSDGTRETAYEAFFSALAAQLSGGQPRGLSTFPEDAEDTWLAEGIRAIESLAGRIAAIWNSSSELPNLRRIYREFRLERPIQDTLYVQRCFIAIRLALRDIAIDLCLIARSIDPRAAIEKVDLQGVQTSPFWLNTSWLEAFSERRLLIHSGNGANELVECISHSLDHEITEFGERADLAMKLALFAADNGLVQMARKQLLRAIHCLLGYGRHKDFFALEVLESLRLLARHGDTEACNVLLELAGPFEAITKYTDGDETNYVREEYYKAVAELFPNRAHACYAHLISEEKWHYAELLANAFVGTNCDESRTGQALLETYISPSEIHVLEEIGSVASSKMGAVLMAVKRKTGSRNESVRKQNGDKSGEHSIPENAHLEELDADSRAPNPGEFPPGDLASYLTAIGEIRDYKFKRQLVAQWLNYWADTGRAEEALSDLELIALDNRHHSELDEAFDVAHQLAIQLQGRSQGFDWLVCAHIARSAWEMWPAGTAAAVDRLKSIAEQFPENWEEFIQRTSRSKYPRIHKGSVVVGLFRLVYYLFEVGQRDLARAYALRMASIFRDEVAEQPIPVPEWAK